MMRIKVGLVGCEFLVLRMMRIKVKVSVCVGGFAVDLVVGGFAVAVLLSAQ